MAQTTQQMREELMRLGREIPMEQEALDIKRSRRNMLIYEIKRAAPDERIEDIGKLGNVKKSFAARCVRDRGMPKTWYIREKAKQAGEATE